MGNIFNQKLVGYEKWVLIMFWCYLWNSLSQLSNLCSMPITGWVFFWRGKSISSCNLLTSPHPPTLQPSWKIISIVSFAHRWIIERMTLSMLYFIHIYTPTLSLEFQFKVLLDWLTDWLTDFLMLKLDRPFCTLELKLTVRNTWNIC